jgi:hypothetical protein
MYVVEIPDAPDASVIALWSPIAIAEAAISR